MGVSAPLFVVEAQSAVQLASARVSPGLYEDEYSRAYQGLLMPHLEFREESEVKDYL